MEFSGLEPSFPSTLSSFTPFKEPSNWLIDLCTVRISESTFL
ncbi:hypothetical protein D046_1137A, partial [Vibrio parahaemolyticus V-223/04]